MKLFLTVVFLSFFFVNVFSQSIDRINVASFKALPTDLDARVNFPKKDQNGDVCAIIKVATSETGFSWDGDQLGIIAAEKKTGEYWLYVPYGSKRLTVKHNQLGILRDYRYPEPIEKACVYELKITTAKVKTIIEEQELVTAWLTLKSNPDGADVYINNIQKGVTNFTDKLTPGKYTYRLEKPLYHNEAGSFEITGEEANGKKMLAIDLKPAFGYLKISTLPEDGAKVIINDVEASGLTPFTSEKLKSGKHTATVKKEMYQPKSLEVTIEDGKTTTENVTLSPNFAKVTIVTQPESDIYLDGNKIGTGSYTARVLAGIHAFEGKKESHYPDKKEREVTVGNDFTVNLTLQPQLGNLEIVSTPIEATVTLNGAEKGTTPITLKKMLAGNYELQLAKEGFSKISKTITIKEGQTVSINEKLPSGSNVSKKEGQNVAINEKLPSGTNVSKKEGQTAASIEKLVAGVNGSKKTESSSEDKGKIVPSTSGSTVTDLDGNIYSTVTIGTQVWMASNLKTTKYKDGTAIPMVTDDKAWTKQSIQGCCWYNNEATTNNDGNGLLYNWYTVSTLKLCPTGWHVPTDPEWYTLTDFLGGADVAGKKLKETGTIHWPIPNNKATNETGFTAIPSGNRSSNGSFELLGRSTYWWTSAEYSSVSAWTRYLNNSYGGVRRDYYEKRNGFSVRCLRD